MDGTHLQVSHAFRAIQTEGEIMTAATDERVELVKATFGDHLLEPEIKFLRETQLLFEAASAARKRV